MRFFKYLVFIVLQFISIHTFATTGFSAGNDTCFTTAQSACNYLLDLSNDPSDFKVTTSSSTCHFYNNKNQWYRASTLATCQIQTKCEPKDYPVYFYFDAGTPIPQQRCKQNPDGTFCKRISKPNPIILNHENNRQSVTLYSESETPVQSCSNLDDGECDKTDPYGACYQPPDDGCTRQADGSIICPDDTPPPQPDNTCHGATYCKRPPEGCGEGYVSGSFNGELLCVKSGPSTPPDPTDPPDPEDNNCKNGDPYCSKPPNQSCPDGYYESSYQGQTICVKNTPDPNKPNPNDPNNKDPNDPNNPPDPNDPNNPSEGFDASGIIGAIQALRDSLLSAIGGVSGKLTNLVEGQKTSNEHLKNIKEQSVKTNEKLDTSNKHLDKIEDATGAASESLGDIKDASFAASEALGDLNKKTDKIFSDEGKDEIEKLGQQSSDPRYFDQEYETYSALQKFANTLSYSSSHTCISDLTITNIPLYGSMTVPLSNWCDLLALVKLLMKLAVLMLALRMIDATVRAF
ncbi:hypothetical protein F4U02_00955 [Acinetobacter haemolyticus]|uniref:hypothetical protein n=1 Tax=Acinetobacter haemolyticus TaxID=29430 RepID=UPI0012986268|nr:hypothetical protein [Acinetobacter haemolyticus]MQZ29582.1 hypothetical protein [Acinetobacter haemolyticus]